jgi:hypothetical protein
MEGTTSEFARNSFGIPEELEMSLLEFWKNYFKELIWCDPGDTGLPGARSKGSRPAP